MVSIERGELGHDPFPMAPSDLQVELWTALSTSRRIRASIPSSFPIVLTSLTLFWMSVTVRVMSTAQI